MGLALAAGWLEVLLEEAVNQDGSSPWFSPTWSASFGPGLPAAPAPAAEVAGQRLSSRFRRRRPTFLIFFLTNATVAEDTRSCSMAFWKRRSAAMIS